MKSRQVHLDPQIPIVTINKKVEELRVNVCALRRGLRHSVKPDLKGIFLYLGLLSRAALELFLQYFLGTIFKYSFKCIWLMKQI